MRKEHKRSRGGFGIMYAIIVLVLISTIGVYTLELSSKSVKSASDEHLKIQLELYQNSAIEYAILWLSENKSRSQDQNGADLNISFGDGYSFQMKMYATDPTLPPESNGTVIMDIVGRFDASSEPIIVAKRVVVKP